MSTPGKPYPSDVTDDKWAFAASYLTLRREDAHQRDYPLRDVFDALRWVVKTGAQWRFLPGDFPPWYAVYQQARRWPGAPRTWHTTSGNCSGSRPDATRPRRR